MKISRTVIAIGGRISFAGMHAHKAWHAFTGEKKGDKIHRIQLAHHCWGRQRFHIVQQQVHTRRPPCVSPFQGSGFLFGTAGHGRGSIGSKGVFRDDLGGGLFAKIKASHGAKRVRLASAFTRAFTRRRHART